jgi:hypothetical protein
MVQEGLKIVIDAETKEALTGFKDLITGLDGVDNAAVSFNKSMRDMQVELTNLKKKLSTATDASEIIKLNSAINKTSDSIRKQSEALQILTNTTKAQSVATTSLGNAQVIAAQKSGEGIAKAKVNYTDFGRVLQDLPYGFNAIANNLTQLIPSAGALGLAFTAIVTAVTFATNGFTAWTGSTKNAKKELEDLNKYTEDFASNLAKEKAAFETLYQTATNANIPLEQRNVALKELRATYGNYFANFTNEAILAGKATSAYNELSDALIRTARARAAQDRIVEIQNKLITKEIELQNIAKKAQEDASKAKAERFNTGVPGAASIVTTAEQARQGIFAEASRNAKVVANDIQTLNNELRTYVDLVQQNQAKPFKVEKIPEPKKAKTEKIEPIKIEPVRNKNYRNDINQQQKTVVPVPTTTDTTQIRLKENQQLNQILQTQYEKQKLNNDALAEANIYVGLLSPSIDNVFNALASGGDVFQALGDSVKQLALDLAKAAVKAAILGAIMNVIAPGSSAAIGGGGGFGSLFKGLLGFANGGIVSKPTIGVVGERNESEAIMPLSRLSGMLNMAANIGASNMGGSGEFVIRGNDLVLATNRANSSLNLRRG